MAYFPFFIDIKNKDILVVGGGEVAYRKIIKLLPFEPSLTVIAQKVQPNIKEISGIKIIERSYVEGDEKEYSVVIAATSDREVNKTIYRLCNEKKILVNVVDDPSLCSFIFPSIIKKGKLSIGISSSGSSPTTCIALKEKIDDMIPSNIDDILDFLYEERKEIKKREGDEKKRSEILRSLFNMCMEKKRALTKEESREIYKG